jgi:hypothetical protein
MISEQWAHRVLVSPNHLPDEVAHNRCRRFSQCRCRDWRSVTLSASRAGGLHITTTSTASVRLASRLKVSLIKRLMRLRSTARGAHLREIARPSRGSRCWSVPRRASSVKNRSPLFTGWSKTRLKSFGRSRRLRRGNCSLANRRVLRADAARPADAVVGAFRASGVPGPWRGAP